MGYFLGANLRGTDPIKDTNSNHEKPEGKEKVQLIPLLAIIKNT
jgi:hypothetical protein